MVVFENVTKEDIEKLQKRGFHRENGKGLYEESRFLKKNVTLIYYNSKKLLLQGKKADVEKVAEEIRILKIGTEQKSEHFKREAGWIIGSDESLKGDTFGGVVVAAVKADNRIRQELQSIGVADSKTLQDKEIILIAEKIKKIAPCEIQSILPEEYNQNGKITLILNQLHKECARYLGEGTHIVDKYPGCTIGEIREEKAESKYIEVAAASILARAAALQQMDHLSSLAGFALPKGSTHVLDALKRLKEKGLDFKKFVKIDFRNVREYLN
jgi:ribonuclease HIII